MGEGGKGHSSAAWQVPIHPEKVECGRRKKVASRTTRENGQSGENWGGAGRWRQGRERGRRGRGWGKKAGEGNQPLSQPSPSPVLKSLPLKMFYLCG